MQLRHLTHLVALAEQGSFGRAAEAVHLSQPAFSRSIDKLEEDLRARLVDRVYGQVRFTAAGELVLARARELVADAGLIRREVAELQGLAIGTLDVGLGAFAASMLGRVALSQMLQRHPQLTVRVELADANTLCEQLHRRELDLFIADTRGLKKQPGLQMKRMPNVPVSFFVAPGHPLLAHAALSLEQAMDHAVACPRLPDEVKAFFDRQVKRTDRALFNVECDDVGILRDLAHSAGAVILAPDFAVADAAGAPPLVRLPMKKMGSMRTHYSIVMPANRTLSPAALAFSVLVQGMMAPAVRKE